MKKMMMALVLLPMWAWGQGTWEWQNLLPQGNQLNDVAVLDENVAVAVGVGGIIIRTGDQGENWEIIDSNVSTDLFKVDFVDGNVGWACGMLGTMLKTEDSGQTWHTLSMPYNGNILDLQFIDEEIGYCASGHAIFKTTNGGAYWSQNQYLEGNIRSLDFINPEQGWITDTAGNIYVTHNGGQEWIKKYHIENSWFQDIDFVSDFVGWAVSNGRLFKTIDGGQNWLGVALEENSMTSIYFVDENNGFIAGGNGVIWVTHNSGAVWEKHLVASGTNFTGINFNNESLGVAVATGGRIYKTTDLGVNWQKAFKGETDGINSIYFIDMQKGWAVGNSGAVLKTLDGGEHWIKAAYNLTENLYTVGFIDENTGWINSPQNFLMRTTDGGLNWTRYSTVAQYGIYKLQFVSALEAWGCSHTGNVYHTIDGGEHWDCQFSNANYRFNSMFFIDNQRGWICGENGLVLNTLDGGENWVSQLSGTLNTLRSIVFVNSLNGWSGGDNGTLLHTTDGGKNWDVKDIYGSLHISTICFSDESHGYLSGSNGGIYTYNSESDQWDECFAKLSAYITCSFALDSNHVWFAGNNGVILKYADSMSGTPSDNDVNLFSHTDLLTQVANSQATAWGDIDGDGDDDLFVANAYGVRNFLYNNNGYGGFSRISSRVCAPANNSYGGAWGDFDNDGDLDLYVANNGAENEFYQNDGSGGLTLVANSSVTEASDASYGASWCDYDNDGHLDLFVANSSGQNNALYHNNGDGSFTAVTEGVVVTDGSDATCGVWGDYDNDGDADLFVTTGDDSPGLFYENQLGGQFVQKEGYIFCGHRFRARGASWADFDNDGDLDLFVTNRYATNSLYINQNGTHFLLAENSPAMENAARSRGSNWADMDLDGDLDLLVMNVDSPARCYENTGNGGFTAHDLPPFSDDPEKQYLHYGCAVSDYDNDGDPELAVAMMGVNDMIYENRVENRHWLKVQLEGTSSNRQGVGARVVVVAEIDGQTVRQRQELQTQSGFGGQNSSTLIFGLGETTTADSLIVYWPGGIIQALTNVAVNQTLTVEETAPEPPVSLPITRVTSHAIAQASGAFEGSCWGDYDHDGDDDVLLVGRTGTANQLYRNDGQGDYTLQPVHMLAFEPLRSPCWVDVDNDGDVDLLSTANQGVFYLNDGQGDFEKRTSEMFLDTPWETLPSSFDFADIDSDGDLDLFCTSATPTEHWLYVNQGDGMFRKSQTTFPVSGGPQGRGGCQWGDYNNDGFPDILYVTVGSPYGLNLYKNNQDGSFLRVESPVFNLAHHFHTEAINWIDFDNDLDLDLYVGAEGGISEVIRNDGDGEFTRLPIGEWNVKLSSDWTDLNNDGFMDLCLPSGLEFGHEVAINVGELPIVYQEISDYKSYGWVSIADYDEDGDQDLLYTGGEVFLYRNDNGAGSWLKVRLQGQTSNSKGIGARVVVKAQVSGVVSQLMRYKMCRSNSGRGQSSGDLHFGLGNATVIDTLTIHWPSGIVQQLTDVDVNQRLTVVEQSSAYEIAAITDIPGDQGRQVRVSWNRHGDDLPGAADPISHYALWRQRGEISAPSEAAKQADVWDYVETVPARRAWRYAFVASTLKDSSAAGIAWTRFMVTAHAASGGSLYETAVDSGYSVDNRPPSSPGSIAVTLDADGNLCLAWEGVDDKDLAHYAVYRSRNASCTSTDAGQVGTAVLPAYIDRDLVAGNRYYYQITAVDSAGNESEVSEEASTAGLDEDKLAGGPEVFRLHQNHPNPFNPSTTIRFELPQTVHVKLTVYDVQGRRVVVLRDGEVEAGIIEVEWDGCDASGRVLPSGVYLCCLDAGHFRVTRKMMLMQ